MAGEDRISLLPDELLHHILSFLHSTKDRAQTSLLSRRFRHLWAHHPDLHLSMRHSLNPEELDSIAQSYVLTVDSCLRSFAAPSLRSFTIDLWLPTSCPHAVFKAHSKVADRWLRFAGLHSVLKLSLHPRSQIGEGYARIPSSLFCCRSIEDLFLMYGTFPAVPRNFKGFLNLKKLHIGLSSVWDDTLADLLDCCPALEILKLVGCRGLTSVEVSPRNLPRLREVLLFNDESMEASIDAPNLSYINFAGNLSNLDWNSSSVLSKASLTDKTEVGFQNLDDWMKMIGAISNVALLKVNSWFFQFEIPKDYLNGPMFKNLKELYCDIDWISGSVLRALTCNLGECPLLEILYIELSREKRSAIKNSVQKANSENSEDETDISSGLPCFRHKDALLKCVEDEYEQDEWDPLEHISELDSLFCHLKTITLKEFLGSKNEMRLAAYLLRKAIALEEFIIFDFLMRGELELEEAFARVPRVSSQVQMKFSPWWNMLYSLWPSWRKFC